MVSGDVQKSGKMVARKIKIVDLKDFENRREEIVKDLMEAAEDIGFFYIVNHGLPQEVVDGQFANVKR